MICRSKGCKNTAIEGETLCGYCDELAEDGEPIAMKRPRSAEYLARESARKAEQWKAKKAEQEAKRDHAKEIVHQLIANKRENGRKPCAAKVKKGTMGCHFHATHGNFCFIHKSLAED